MDPMPTGELLRAVVSDTIVSDPSAATRTVRRTTVVTRTGTASGSRPRAAMAAVSAAMAWALARSGATRSTGGRMPAGQ
jgi:hypothetical protein